MYDVSNDVSVSRSTEMTNAVRRNGGLNRATRETVIRKSIPVQRDLMGRKLECQKTFYEETRREVTYEPTHHSLNTEKLHFYIYPTNYEVREYQFNIVRKALLQNTLCAIPTGMGKTFIASTIMLNFFNWAKEGKIIFTAPTRPLVAQQIKACLGITGIPSDQTAILLDKSRKNREEIWAEKRVFFTTPQVVENDLKRGVLHPKSIICLVVDEAHRATGSYAYTNIVKFISRFNTSYRILALTATPGANLEIVQDVINNLEISKIEIRTEESLDIAKYMKRRYQKKILVELTSEVEDLIEKIGIAIMPVLKQAIELNIYEECEPSQINAFKAMQYSKKIVANPSIPEGIKWRNFFILQLLNHVGQMLKRIKIYGIRTFYSYFMDKYKEFTVKYDLGKSTNKTAAEFYYNPILKSLISDCEHMLNSQRFLSHAKFRYMQKELEDFFSRPGIDSRVIIFTELRESALEIVKFIDDFNEEHIRPHIFIGQAKGKEGFDEVSFTRKHKPKGRKKVEKLRRQEEEKEIEEEKAQKKKQEQMERNARRTGSSEEAQVNGMTQKQQKQVIKDFKTGVYNVLVCTSIGEEGLDIGEVDLIICFDTTGSPIKNVQRMGRTGRKRDGEIVLLFSGNEASKFEQAMKDYYNLQSLLSKNNLDYCKSDRILPNHIQPICRKEFISIREEDKEVNAMEDSDDVIQFATQCMLGKKTTKKRKSTKKELAKREKQFFMPDNVNTGIIPAVKLVNRIKVEDTSGGPLKDFPALDNLQYDSTEYSSPSKSDGGGSINEERRSFLDMYHDENITSGIVKQKCVSMGSSAEHTDSSNFENTSLGHKIDCDEYSQSFSSSKRIKVKIDQDLSQHQLVGSANKKAPLHLSIYKGGDNAGLLRPQERVFFLKKYSADEIVSIDTIPSFQNNTMYATIPHSARNNAILSMFQGLNEDNKASILQMNRNKCIARGLKSGTISLQEDAGTIIADRHIVNSNSRELNSSNNTNYFAVNMDELDEILGSDSDF